MMVSEVRQFLTAIADFQVPKSAEALREQVLSLRSVRGSATFLSLELDKSQVRRKLPDGLLGPRVFVRASDGKTLLGELLVWVTNGLISELEYAWYGETAPTKLPEPSQITLKD